MTILTTGVRLVQDGATPIRGNMTVITGAVYIAVSDNSASLPVSSALNAISRFVFRDALRCVRGSGAVPEHRSGRDLPLPQSKAPSTGVRGVIHFGPEP